ncbi:MAG: hypothetical protein ACR2FH_07570, partial [Caulobacteraceae bacterium]
FGRLVPGSASDRRGKGRFGAGLAMMAMFGTSRCGVTGAAIALLWAALAHAAPAADGPTRIGVYYNDENAVAVARALGVTYLRLHTPIDPPNARALDKIRAAKAAGFKVEVNYNNREARKSVPVADDAAFKASLGRDLDATHPDLVVIQNEEDGVRFAAGGPTEYLRELTDAVQVAHAKGYKIANGGLSSAGVKLAYWHHLWLTGQRQAADEFARDALKPSVSKGRRIIGDIPDRAAPGRAILTHNPPLLNKLRRIEPLIAGYRQTGIDYVNFHWYEADARSMGQVARWLEEAVGVPAISNEMGQYSANGDQVIALLTEARAAGMPYVFWFAKDGHGPAVGLAGDDARPRPNGVAFRAFVAAHR